MLGRSRRSTEHSTERDTSSARPVRWLVLVASLPTDAPEARMQVLRTFETLGCGVLREGAYVLPDNPDNKHSFERLAEYVCTIQGSAYLLSAASFDAAQEQALRKLFDRSEQYVELAKTIESLKSGFGISNPSAIARVVQRQRDEFERISAQDFFGSSERELVVKVLADTEQAVNTLMFPTTGKEAERTERMTSRKQYFRKIWATRKPLSVDRLASAWLIRRFIDAEAKLVWLDKTETASDAALSFGYEGAQFANSKTRVTYEELVSFFRLEDTALIRIGTLVRSLESGDMSVPEAAGIDTMLAGARHRAKSNDELLKESEKTLDMVYETYYDSKAASAKSR